MDPKGIWDDADVQGCLVFAAITLMGAVVFLWLFALLWEVLM